MKSALAALLAAVLGGLFVLVAPDAGAAIPVPRTAVKVTGLPIEDLAPYVPQDSCDPVMKRGTGELGALLSRTYPDVSWSSTRPCDGSVSEHHDGRAIDWMASVRTKTTRLEAHTLINWLLASDAQGNRFAMARRLGVMYLIYNGRMWGAWDGQWEEYNNCLSSAKLATPAYDDYCHRSHVHISLSWNGARGRTSFWTGVVRATDYGPCRKPGKQYAPAWSERNLTPCP